jgi:hypothetical protein
VAERETAGEIQAGNEVLGARETAVALLIFEDGELVRALGAVRRRIGDFVVLGAEELIDFDRLQAGGSRVLQVLEYPQAALVVEADGNRLPDVRLAGDELDLESHGHLHALDGVFGRKSLAMHGGGGEKTSDECE